MELTSDKIGKVKKKREGSLKLKDETSKLVYLLLQNKTNTQPKWKIGIWEATLFVWVQKRKEKLKEKEWESHKNQKESPKPWKEKGLWEKK